MKQALMCGAGGLTGGHLAGHLKAEGAWVGAVDSKSPEFFETQTDDFAVGDLRDLINV